MDTRGRKKTKSGRCRPRPKRFLFVWESVYSDYTSGMAVAVAVDKEEAIRLVARHMAGNDSDADDVYKGDLQTIEPKVFPLTESHGFGVYGGS